MGLQEIADMLGVTRQRADQLTREKGFPDPMPERRHGYGKRRTWGQAAVRAWAEANGRLS